MTEIKIIKQDGKRIAYAKAAHSPIWLRVPLNDALKGLRTGFIPTGFVRGVPCKAN